MNVLTGNLTMKQHLFLVMIWRSMDVIATISIHGSASKPFWCCGHGIHHCDVIKLTHSPRYWPFVRWLPVTLTKANDTELWYFLWSAYNQTFAQIIETLVIWDAIGLTDDVTVIILFQENSVNTIAAVLSVIILDLWQYKQHNILDICFEWLYKKGRQCRVIHI